LEAVGGEGEPQTALMSLKVLQVYDLEVEVQPSTAEIKAGKVFIYTVTVTNKGNGEDGVQLSVTNLDPKLIATFDYDDLLLAPGEMKDVTLTIKAKSSAKGSKTFDVKAESKDGDASDTAGVGITIKVVEQKTDLTAYILIVAIVAGVSAVAVIIWWKRTH
jgi:uncharacterized membrane protein